MGKLLFNMGVFALVTFAIYLVCMWFVRLEERREARRRGEIGSPPKRLFDRFSFKEATAVAVALLLATEMTVNRLLHDAPAQPFAAGWHARAEIPSLTRIDTSQVTWRGEGPRSPSPVGRMTLASVAEDSLVRDALLAPLDTRPGGWRLLSVEVDSLVPLRPGDPVELVGWAADTAAPASFGSAHVVAARHGHVLVVLPAAAALPAAKLARTGKLAVAGIR